MAGYVEMLVDALESHSPAALLAGEIDLPGVPSLAPAAAAEDGE